MLSGHFTYLFANTPTALRKSETRSLPAPASIVALLAPLAKAHLGHGRHAGPRERGV